MIRPIHLCWCTILAAGTVAITVTSRDAIRARRSAQAAQRELQAVKAMAEELASLRAEQPVPRAPAAGLAAKVSAALTRSGLPPTALASLSPESADLRGGRQRAVITLATPTLAQVGSFLASWREAEPEWIVSNIELTPLLGAPSQPGADLPLRTVIGIESSAPGNGGGT